MKMDMDLNDMDRVMHTTILHTRCWSVIEKFRLKAIHWRFNGNTLATGDLIATYWKLNWRFNGDSLEFHWQHIGNSLVIAWQQIGNSLAIQWQLVGDSLATHWQLAGDCVATNW